MGSLFNKITIGSLVTVLLIGTFFSISSVFDLLDHKPGLVKGVTTINPISLRAQQEELHFKISAEEDIADTTTTSSNNAETGVATTSNNTTGNSVEENPSDDNEKNTTTISDGFTADSGQTSTTVTDERDKNDSMQAGQTETEATTTDPGIKNTDSSLSGDLDRLDLAPLPDLKPIRLQIHKAVQQTDNRVEAGDELLIKIAVKNIGRTAAGAAHYEISWGADRVISNSLPALEPGELFEASQSIIWPEDSSLAKIEFILWADAQAEVRERNERNNRLGRVIRQHSDRPDLTLPPVDELEFDEASGEHLIDGEAIVVPAHLEDKSEERLKKLHALRQRIKNLKRQISQTEAELIRTEKDLSQTVDKLLTRRLEGRILLQVENHGEAWYVDETTEQRFYLADGETAYEALQAFGLGISNSDLELIPVGVEDRAEKIDTDEDGLDDQLETALGTDANNPDTDGDGFIDGEEIKADFHPDGPGSRRLDLSLAERLEGKLLLQVEGKGEAWYVHKGRRYYMKNGHLAYQIMRFLSLGITNDDLRQIAVGDLTE